MGTTLTSSSVLVNMNSPPFLVFLNKIIQAQIIPTLPLPKVTYFSNESSWFLFLRNRIKDQDFYWGVFVPGPLLQIEVGNTSMYILTHNTLTFTHMNTYMNTYTHIYAHRHIWEILSSQWFQYIFVCMSLLPVRTLDPNNTKNIFIHFLSLISHIK